VLALFVIKIYTKIGPDVKIGANRAQINLGFCHKANLRDKIIYCASTRYSQISKLVFKLIRCKKLINEHIVITQ